MYLSLLGLRKGPGKNESPQEGEEGSEGGSWYLLEGPGLHGNESSETEIPSSLAFLPPLPVLQQLEEERAAIIVFVGDEVGELCQ